MWPLCIEVLAGTLGLIVVGACSRNDWRYDANEYEYASPGVPCWPHDPVRWILSMVNNETVQWKLGGFELQVK